MSPDPITARGSGFPSTHWTVVRAAGGADGTKGFTALTEVCRAYWPPLYAFARRLGHSPEDAEDLTQGFFAALLEHPFLDRADAGKGHFRSFLLGAFKHYLGKERERAGAQKRGGGLPHLSLDVGNLEARFAHEFAESESPEALYEQAWAVAMLDEAMRRLEDECRRAGRLPLFAQLQSCLEGDHSTGRYAEIAQRLGTTEGTIQVTVRRLRQRYLDLLRLVILETVGRPEEVDDELRHLRNALRG